MKQKFSKREIKITDEQESLVKVVFEFSEQTYGVRRVYEELKRRGRIDFSIWLVRMIMRKMKLKSVYCGTKRRYVITTDSKHNKRIAENKLQRNFVSERPNEKWCGDVTYVNIKGGWVYLATVIDLFSRKIVGYAVGDKNDSDLCCEAFLMALVRRKMPRNFVWHSDRGVVYSSDKFLKMLESNNIDRSMSRKGDCWDNAVAENFNGIIKVELLNRHRYKSLSEVKIAVSNWIEKRYNSVRLHSSLGYSPPDEFEENYLSKVGNINN